MNAGARNIELDGPSPLSGPGDRFLDRRTQSASLSAGRRIKINIAYQSFGIRILILITRVVDDDVPRRASSLSLGHKLFLSYGASGANPSRAGEFRSAAILVGGGRGNHML